MSLFADYIKERCGMGTIETEDGFATFQYVNDEMVYIVDLYVVPEKRKLHVATAFADKIVEEARKIGRKTLIGSVDTGTKGAEDSCKVLEAYGMTIFKIAEPMVFYYKSIEEEVSIG